MCNIFAANAAATVKEEMLLYYVADSEGLEVTGEEYDKYVDEQYDSYVKSLSKDAEKLDKDDFVEQQLGDKDTVKKQLLFTEVTDYLCNLVKTQLNK